MNAKVIIPIIFSTMLLCGSAHAAKPPKEPKIDDVNVVNTPDVNVANVPDVVVVNGPSNPVSVKVEDEYFVNANTVALSTGVDFASKEIFTVPPDKTLIIEYIDAFNATNSWYEGQEARLRVSYPDGFGYAGASFVFRTTSNVQEAGGARVFLPVPPGTTVSASIVRTATGIQTTYRVTVTGRLVPAPLL